MGGVGFNPPQRSAAGRNAPVSMEMLQSWLSKLGAGVDVDMSGAAQTISSATSSPLSWARATMDTHGFWSPTDPTNLTVPRGMDGVYIASGAIRWEGNASGYRTQSIHRNMKSGVSASATRPTLFSPSSTTPQIYPTTSWRMYLAAGDQVSLVAYQTSGVSIDAEGSDDSWLQLTRVGDLPREARIL